ncbi:endo-1,4-beta-xylanase [Phytohabitans rumicis]|uniref:Beta-xylanase n=1 Tax=Phytohabitans rumicis TaxID=1076125 RepID=A0A6V8KYS9_9ACTN|nr:endo-1,4-beta-xylanase [Phytohabitans rumicis]GFJ90273.1 beta-xylanase [Phytohabitans rumicis]
MRYPRIMVAACLLGLAVSAVAVPSTAASAAPQVVLTNDFEDGATQGWFARGSAAVANTTDAAHGGTHSLLTTNRAATWQGPGRDMRAVLLPEAVYVVEAYARVAAGGPQAAIHVTMQRTPAGGSTAFERVASATVTPDGWVVLRGEYRFSGDVTELQLYLESADATVSFLMDDVTVTMTAPPPGGPPDEAGVTSDFEAGTAQGWAPRIGSETVTVTDADAHGGTRSLLTTGRTQSYTGPAINMLGRMGKGKKYTFTLWVKLAPGQAPADLRLTIERRWQGTPSYELLAGASAVNDGAWSQISGSYTLGADVDFLSVYVETAGGSSASFYLDDFQMTYVVPMPIQTDIPSLKDVLADDFPVGTALVPSDTLGEKAKLVAKHYDSATAGNAMKWDATEPVEGQFSWADADTIANFATANGMGLRGHTLVWHQQTPAWVFQRPDGTPLTSSAEDKALLLSRLENHIRAVAGRYAGRIYAWDVANEVVDEGEPDGYRRSRWFEVAGLDYLRTAFRVAREVDPNAKLFINDYNTEYPAKRVALFNLVKLLRAEGVPIDGVGHQLHVNIERQRIGEIEKSIQLFATLGVDQQVTELDMSAYTNFVESYPSFPATTMAQQGIRYRDLFDLFDRYSSQISSVTLWGAADDGTWLDTFPFPRRDDPLLFDRDLQAKPAYWGVADPTKLPSLGRTLTVPSARPTVDGKRDQVWDYLPGTDVHSATGLGTTFQFRWDTRTLYVLAEVTDRSNNKTDTVDVFVGDTRHRIQRGGKNSKPIDGGYRVEAAIPLSPAVSAGAKLRVDLRVRDAATGAQASWNDQSHAQDTSTAERGEITLVPAVSTVDVVRGTPVLDGVAEAVWSKACAITTNVRVSGSDGATATAKLLWDAGHLYVLATVTDPTLDESSPNTWEQDSIEIFVDPDNSKGSGYNDEDGQYRVSFTNKQTVTSNFGGFRIADNLRSATRVVPGGYVVEASIELDSITPAIGSLLGFDLQVNDATGGTRTAATTWHDPTGRSYVDTSRWGVARLVR